jgi:hypothetical protein
MSDNHKNIRQNLFLVNQDPELAEAFDQVLGTGSVFNTNECPVVDTNGNNLVRDGKYRYRNEIVRIKDWQFGAGNLLDRYYWVWYIDSKLDDCRITISAKYRNGVFGGTKYVSQFAPLD